MAKPKNPKPEQSRETIRMTRDSEQYPAPHTADVHPDEVKNMQAHSWVISNDNNS